MEEEPSNGDGNMTENQDAEKEPESEEPAEQAVTETQEVSEEKVRTVKPALTYQAYVQTEGWQSWKQENELAGTEGKSRRMEALRIKLQGGELGEKWCSGRKFCIECTDGKLRDTAVKKEDPSPAAGTRGFIKAYTNTNLTYRGHVQKIGNTKTSVN